MMARKRSEGLSEKAHSVGSNSASHLRHTGNWVARRRRARALSDRGDRSEAPSPQLDEGVCGTAAAVSGGTDGAGSAHAGPGGVRAAPRFEELGWRQCKDRAGSAAQAPSAPPTQPGPACDIGDITIHVIDEVRRVRRDFTCKQALLLSHMKYFESYLAGARSDDEVDISVHCDVNVFEWLVGYMQDTAKAGTLETNTVVSILISSDFLQMGELVDACLEFIHRSINQIVRLPIDLGCLSGDLVKRLAALFTDEELELVKDRHDKLLSRLFAQKLEDLLGDDDNALSLCAFCSGIFTFKQRERTTCPKAAIFIDFHGNVVAQHVASKDWDVSYYVQHCRETLRLSWRQIYWRMWGRLQTLYCKACRQHFCGAELEHCTYHPENPIWKGAPQSHLGTYPCCKQPAARFGVLPRRSGCRARPHVVDCGPEEGGGRASGGGSSSSSAPLEKLLKHRELVCVPFADRNAELLLPEDERTSTPGGSPLAAETGEDEDEGGGSSEDYGAEDDDLCRESFYGGDFWGEGDQSKQGLAYCFAPLPEHCRSVRRRRAPGRAGAGRRRRPSRGTPSGPRRPGTARGSRTREASVSRQRSIPTERRQGQGRRDEGRDAHHLPGASPTSTEDATETVMQVHHRWPSPPAEEAPTFFTMRHPGGSSNRKSEYRLDMLLEDDRRRMDQLAERIRHCREAHAERQVRGRASPGASQRLSLAWVSEAAAAAAPPVQ